MTVITPSTTQSSDLVGGGRLTPAINTIYPDAAHPSALVLGYRPGGHAEAPLPTCDTVINQPCRANQVPVPAGAMTVG